MRFRYMSDLHLEIAPIDLPILEKEHESILLLAGDICNATKRMSFHRFFVEMCERFKEVVMVPGNHFYYDASLKTAKSKFYKLLELDHMDLHRWMPSNFHLLDDEKLELDDVVIVGSTLWTSFRNGNPIIKLSAESYMNDYVYIRTGPDIDPYMRRMRANDVFDMNFRSTEYIFEEFKLAKLANKKVIALTHHAPSHQSIHEKYSGKDENEFYANHFDYRLMDGKGPDFWVHGHLHDSVDYELGSTRVLCNPRGYYGYENDTGFDPLKEFVL